MIKEINSWAQTIIISIIIITIIEIILPEGNNKKYIKIILGIYLIFSIISPLIKGLKNKSLNLRSLYNSLDNKYENNINKLETSSYIENIYKEKIEEDIFNKLNEKGYKALNIDIFVEDNNDDEYGKINSITVSVIKNDVSIKEKNEDDVDNKENKKNNTINTIKDINIDISNNKNVNKNKSKNFNDKNNETFETNEDISKGEIDELKEFIKNTYCIEKEKIYINE